MKISVAAVPYFWSKQAYLNFYAELAESEVDIVYLGETVCSKRRNMKLEDWLEVGEALESAGKEVVLSSMTLIEADSELKYLRAIAQQKRFLVEANDFSAIEISSCNDNQFVAGCAINIYNQSSLTQLAKLGMTRWSIPVELGKEDLSPLVDCAHELQVELEYQVYGRMPLAYSARCFTARHHQLPKDRCEFVCLDYPEGLLAKTQEGDSFAQINGIQTQSAKVVNLLNHLKELESAGIDIVRVVPTNMEDTLKVIDWIAKATSNNLTSKINLPTDIEFCNGYWFQIEGMQFVQSEAPRN